MSDYEKSLKAANEQLMTCPFCGGNAKISDSLIHCGKQMYQPLCLDCDAELGYFDTLGEAVAAWNTRAAVPQEMTAREYVIARRRLCNAHLNAVNQCADDFVTRCEGCLIEDYCEGVKDDVDEEIAIVEEWAREHPETDMMTAKYALPKIDFEERSES